MRAIWKGFLGFGLVTIPVRVYAATERKALRLNMLHSVCATPIRYRKWCPTCDREVEPDDISWGYEYEKAHYVILEEKDFEAGKPPKSRTIEITEFVNLEEIDPIYYEKTYYLEAGEGALKAYNLLMEALRQSHRIALARVVLRTKESMACVRVHPEGLLAMETMYFPQEIRSGASLAAKGAVPATDERELQMAMMLVDSMAGPFQPERYADEYTSRMLEVIRSKAEGQEIVVSAQPETAKVVSLMEALKKSVEVAERARK